MCYNVDMEKKHALVTAVPLLPKNENPFSFYLSLKPPTEALHHARGQVYGIIQVSELFGEQADELQKLLKRLVEEEYFRHPHGGVLEALEDTLELVFKEGTKYLSEVYKERVIRGKPFSVLLAVIWGKVLYIGSIGDGQATFWRNGNTMVLPKNAGQSQLKEQAVHSASGLLEENDLIILSTNQFFHHLELKPLLENFKDKKHIKAQDVADKIADTHYQDNLDDVVAVLSIEFIAIKKEDKATDQIAESELPAETKISSVGNLFGKLKLLKLSIGPILRDFKEKLQSRRKKEVKTVDESNIYLKNFSKKKPNRKRILLIALVLFLILTASIGFKIHANHQKVLNEQLQAKVDAIETQLTDIQNLSAVNPEEAKNELLALQDSIDELRALNPNADTLSGIETEVESLRKTLFQISDFTSVETIAEFDQDASRFILTKNVGENLKLIDATNHQYNNINLATGNAQTGQTFDLQNFSQFGAASDNDNLLYSFTQGVVSIAQSDKELATINVLVPPEQVWGEITQMDTYESNIYLLDKENKQVWKHVPVSGGYSQAIAYLKEDIEADKTPVAIAIDGSVYVGFQDGVIRKYLGGEREDFFIDSIDKPLGENLIMATNQDIDKLVVLDISNNRIVTFDKQGSYLRQYELASISANPQDLAISRDGLYAFILDESQIVKLGLWAKKS